MRMAVTWAGARMVVTWAIARKAAELILPMSLETLKALTWVTVSFAAQSSKIVRCGGPFKRADVSFRFVSHCLR